MSRFYIVEDIKAMKGKKFLIGVPNVSYDLLNIEFKLGCALTWFEEKDGKINFNGVNIFPDINTRELLQFPFFKKLLADKKSMTEEEKLSYIEGYINSSNHVMQAIVRHYTKDVSANLKAKDTILEGMDKDNFLSIFEEKMLKDQDEDGKKFLDIVRQDMDSFIINSDTMGVNCKNTFDV